MIRSIKETAISVLTAAAFPLLLVFYALSFAHAQVAPPASIQASPQHLDSVDSITVANASATTYTLNPGSGQYVYLDWVNVSNCDSATVITPAAPTSITTSNMQGLTYQIGSGSATAGTCAQQFTETWPNGFKASAPGNVTVVMPTFVANQTVTLKIGWSSAP
jgi:hypothetical protein